MCYSDFDGALIDFKFEDAKEFVIVLKWDCIKAFLDNGGKEAVEEAYKDFDVDMQDTEITIRVSIDKIPAGEKEQGLDSLNIRFLIFLSFL